MSDRSNWIEVWGKEVGDEEKGMLFSFPPNQWSEDFRESLVREMEDRGVTEIEIRNQPTKGE